MPRLGRRSIAADARLGPQLRAVESLSQGSAESLPFGDDLFDVVIDRRHSPHLRIVTPTSGRRSGSCDRGSPGDCHRFDTILRRRPLSSHFPETVSIELQRCSPVPRLLEEMARAGFVEPHPVEVSRDYELDDIQAIETGLSPRSS